MRLPHQSYETWLKIYALLKKNLKNGHHSFGKPKNDNKGASATEIYSSTKK